MQGLEGSGYRKASGLNPARTQRTCERFPWHNPRMIPLLKCQVASIFRNTDRPLLGFCFNLPSKDQTAKGRELENASPPQPENVSPIVARIGAQDVTINLITLPLCNDALNGQRILIGVLPNAELGLTCARRQPEGYPATPVSLGDHIRKRRMKLGLLQREVGQRIGASVATVWLWESNRVEPELKWMPAILDFLGYDPTPAGRNLGERLVRHRVRLGWTQKRLAEALRVDQTTLARWETGQKAPWGKYAERIASLLQPETYVTIGTLVE